MCLRGCCSTQCNTHTHRPPHTHRYDLDALTAGKDRVARQEALALQDRVMRSLEELDLATRNRQQEAAFRSLDAATAQLSALINKLV